MQPQLAPQVEGSPLELMSPAAGAWPGEKGLRGHTTPGTNLWLDFILGDLLEV
jgi:hypothetical protein